MHGGKDHIGKDHIGKVGAVGKDHIGETTGAPRILSILHARFAPGAIDAISQEVAKFMNLKRADQTTDAFLMEFDVLREKADARMEMGSGSPDEFASTLCMQDAS